jgi:hypothetical protein
MYVYTLYTLIKATASYYMHALLAVRLLACLLTR